MQKVFNFILLSVVALVAAMPNANAQRVCGSMDNLMLQKAQDPQLEERMQQIENFTQRFEHEHQNNARTVVTIPVVFHVIHNGDALGSSENIPDALIQAQLDQLNKDYRKLNSDASLIPSSFAGVAADAEINFCLAQRTPAGVATTGIERLNKTKSSWTMSQIESSLKPTTIWDNTKYLNIWTVIFGGSDAGLLGYAQFPGGAANTDGVVVVHTSVGSTSNPNSAGGVYGKGRTLTHEVGHWLNLRHIWGDANCGSDLVSDTPTQQTSNYSCPTYPHVTCSNGASGDMFMNYMDYVDDACMYMFTAGQKTRMQALFASGGSRVGLATSNGCTAVGGGGGTTTCGTVSGLSATSITATSATLNWTALSGAASYNVQYKAATATAWTSTTATTNSAAITGLSASTSYSFQVQAVCTGATGTYSTAASFTTLAGGGGTTACTDAYESNNTSSASKTISANGTITANIGSGTDIDWFKFVTVSPATNIKVTLSNLAGDYDLYLYKNDAATLAAYSENSGTTNEVAIFNSTAATTRYIKVVGYNGAYSTTQCYSLQVQTSSSTFKHGSVTADGVVIEAVNAVDLNLFPNPTKDNVTLQYLSTQKAASNIAIFDLMGRKVYETNNTALEGINELNINTTDFAQGVYMVKLTINGNQITKRLAVVK